MLVCYSNTFGSASLIRLTLFGLDVLKGQTAKDKISYFQETPLCSSYFGKNKTIFVKNKTTKTEEWLMCDFFRHAIWLFKSPCQRNQYKHGLQLAHFIAIFERYICLSSSLCLNHVPQETHSNFLDFSLSPMALWGPWWVGSF